ncbi:MAG: zinc metallopeptidase [Gammaproteobacteria bacterium]|nr:zinc metallopeptidase [Gammaproteobacteria bacterium]
MHLLIIILLVALLLYGPQWWARRTFARYRQSGPMKGTGAELVEHLAGHFGIAELQVKVTDQGDHYDPQSRTIGLMEQHYKGDDLTSITIAAHEFGHALQHHNRELGLRLRTRLAKLAHLIEKMGSLFFILAPILALITRVPSSGISMFMIALLSMALATLVHIVTLPVEFDASFNKALPILESGYISPEQYVGARKILRAAAFTYVSASLASLLNIARWFALLRR